MNNDRIDAGELVLVTGASGFLGSFLIEKLAKNYVNIRAVYHSKIPKRLTGLSNVEWVKADLLDVFDVEHIVTNVSYVYHCAADVSFDSKKEDIISKNTEMTANLVNECLEQGVKKLVHTSSIGALSADNDTQLVTEEVSWQESMQGSGYGLSKYQSELEVWRGIAEGLNAVIVNPGVILGGGEYNISVNKMLQLVEKEIPYYTNGGTGWIDVHDVVDAMILLMNSDLHSERFILIENNYSFKTVSDWFAESLGKKKTHKLANGFLTEIYWRIERLLSLITGKQPKMTKDSARIAQRFYKYSNEKFTNLFPDFKFKRIEEVVPQMVQDMHYSTSI